MMNGETNIVLKYQIAFSWGKEYDPAIWIFNLRMSGFILYPSNAEAIFVQSTRTLRLLETV